MCQNNSTIYHAPIIRDLIERDRNIDQGLFFGGQFVSHTFLSAGCRTHPAMCHIQRFGFKMLVSWQ